MAAIPVTESHIAPNFAFQQIDSSKAYRCLILCNPRTPNSFEVGDLYKDISEVRYGIRLNAGRLGTPGLEFIVERKKTSHAPALSATIVFEPGVAEGRDEQGTQRWQLHFCETTWLGRRGGGGHTYDRDPKSIREAPLDDKKGMLKVSMKGYGHLPVDPSAVSALRNAVPAGSDARRLLKTLTSWTDSVDASVYCIIPSNERTNFEARVLAPFNIAVGSRLAPYHQYTAPRNIISLSLPPLPGFRNHICCDMLSTSPTQYGPPNLQLCDTRGRRAAAPVANLNSIGLIRECQAYEAFCEDLGNCIHRGKLVRTRMPVLSSATRAYGSDTLRGQVQLPVENHGYTLYIESAQTTKAHSFVAPRSDTMFEVVRCSQQADGTYAETGEKGDGMVLQASQSFLQQVRSGFVMSLLISGNIWGQQAAYRLADAAVDHVRLRFVRNRNSAQRQLAALTFFRSLAPPDTIAALQGKVLFRAFPTSQAQHDLRPGPDSAWSNVVQVFSRIAQYDTTINDLASLPRMANVSQAEVQFLAQVPARISNFSQVVQTSVAKDNFRTVNALMLALIAVHHRIIVVVEELEDRSKVCYDLNGLFADACGFGRFCQPILQKKSARAYSAVDLDSELTPAPRDEVALMNLSPSDPLHPRRERIELAFKFLMSDMPEHRYMLDEEGSHFNASFLAGPPNRTPLRMSMGDGIQSYLVSRQAIREQYYADRRRILDNAPATVDEIHEMSGRRAGVVRNVLKRTDILICDIATAMSDDVKASFATPVIMLVGTEKMVFGQAVGVLTSFPQHVAAFAFGHPLDPRNPVQFASGGLNEAWSTYSRSLWQMMQNAGTGYYSLG